MECSRSRRNLFCEVGETERGHYRTVRAYLAVLGPARFSDADRLHTAVVALAAAVGPYPVLRHLHGMGRSSHLHAGLVAILVLQRTLRNPVAAGLHCLRITPRLPLSPTLLLAFQQAHLCRRCNCLCRLELLHRLAYRAHMSSGSARQFRRPPCIGIETISQNCAATV